MSEADPSLFQMETLKCHLCLNLGHRRTVIIVTVLICENAGSMNWNQRIMELDFLRSGIILWIWKYPSQCYTLNLDWTENTHTRYLKHWVSLRHKCFYCSNAYNYVAKRFMDLVLLLFIKTFPVATYIGWVRILMWLHWNIFSSNLEYYGKI